MKKLIIGILLLFLLIGLTSSEYFKKPAEKPSDKLIRFHCVANSDTESDQNVKLKVRDAILKQIGPILNDKSSKKESMEVIEQYIPVIENTANDILIKEGKKYRAKAMLGEFIFPIKNYGNVTLPAGKYTALKVVLGEGGGKNWWCVMFPPLCFIDITRGLTSEISDEELKKILNDEEIKSITAFKQVSSKTEMIAKAKESTKDDKAVNSNTGLSKSYETTPKVEFKFKSIEVLKNAINKIINYLKKKG